MSEKRIEGDRPERGGADDSGRHPPHGEANPTNEGAPNLPATAHGSDAASTEDEPDSVDEESMYEERRERDKDRPPSGRG